MQKAPGPIEARPCPTQQARIFQRVSNIGDRQSRLESEYVLRAAKDSGIDERLGCRQSLICIYRHSLVII